MEYREETDQNVLSYLRISAARWAMSSWKTYGGLLMMMSTGPQGSSCSQEPRSGKESRTNISPNHASSKLLTEVISQLTATLQRQVCAWSSLLIDRTSSPILTEQSEMAHSLKEINMGKHLCQRRDAHMTPWNDKECCIHPNLKWMSWYVAGLTKRILRCTAGRELEFG